RSRTSSPSGRRQSMAADATHRSAARSHRRSPVPSWCGDAVEAWPEGRDAETESTIGVAFVELLAHPDVTEEQGLGSPVGFLALHGGLEPGTAEIARESARRSGASWYLIVQPDDLKRHVPSHEHDPAESPLLAGFLDHVDVVISVHGYWGHADDG